MALSSTSRILATNFDSLNQADLWLSHGAEVASEIMMAMLRTSLLLGIQLTIDRNQLLDGVFFLSLGPDGIARELGLAPTAVLPIIMTGSPETPLDGDPMNVRRLLGRGPVDNKPPLLSFSQQLKDVRRPRFLRVSSASAALMGALEATPWLLPKPGPHWYPGCGFVDPLHPLRGDEASTHQVIRDAQEQWVAAAKHGRIAVDIWSNLVAMDDALNRQECLLREACGDDLEPAPLALHVLHLPGSVRTDTVAAIQQWRKQQPETTEGEMRLALRLWSRAYYQAIAWGNGHMLASFNYEGSEIPEEARIGDTDNGLVRRYGLNLLRRSALKKWRDRRSFARRAHRAIRIDGEILDHLRLIDPGTYQQLRRTSGEVVDSVINRHDPASMYDLALACRGAVAKTPSHRRMRRATTTRIMALTLLALLVSALTLFGEFVELTFTEKVLAVVTAVVLGFLASLPWDDISEHFNMRRASMTATLNVSEGHQ